MKVVLEENQKKIVVNNLVIIRGKITKNKLQEPKKYQKTNTKAKTPLSNCIYLELEIWFLEFKKTVEPSVTSLQSVVRQYVIGF
jgi:hypothetical protein